MWRKFSGKNGFYRLRPSNGNKNGEWRLRRFRKIKLIHIFFAGSNSTTSSSEKKTHLNGSYTQPAPYLSASPDSYRDSLFTVPHIRAPKSTSSSFPISPLSTSTKIHASTNFTSAVNSAAVPVGYGKDPVPKAHQKWKTLRQPRSAKTVQSPLRPPA